MSDANGNPQGGKQPPKQSTVVFMLGTIGDTTWRMFVPTIGLMSAGYYADKSFGSTPWLFILGVIVGSVIAGLLIKQQLATKE